MEMMKPVSMMSAPMFGLDDDRLRRAFLLVLALLLLGAVAPN